MHLSCNPDNKLYLYHYLVIYQKAKGSTKRLGEETKRWALTNVRNLYGNKSLRVSEAKVTWIDDLAKYLS